MLAKKGRLLPTLKLTELRNNQSRTDSDRATLSYYRKLIRSLGVTGEEAEMLVHRVAMIAEIKEIISVNGWTQVEAAKQLKVKPPRISELVGANADKFSTDLLIKYLYRLRRAVRIVVDEVPQKNSNSASG